VQGVKRIKDGGMALSSGIILGWRLKMETALMGGARCQLERERRRVPLRARRCWAMSWFPAWAERVTRVRFIFFLFFLFFFCFLISFITFAFWLQFDSNQNLKFSNIQNNIIEQ
jgi:hypothetical protein